MAHIKFVSGGQKLAQGGKLYIDGHKVCEVMSIEPRLFETNEVATVTITLAVDSFQFVPPDPDPREMAELGLKPDDFK